MSTEYQQVPSQQALFSHNNLLDPWLVSSPPNISFAWGPKGFRREQVHSPPLFDADMQWSLSPASTPTFSPKKPAYVPSSQYISTSPPPSLSSSPEDAWSLSQRQTGDDQTLPDEDSLYKTELCRSYMETGTCRYGLKCQFAHGHNEVRRLPRHPKYKTEICKTFHTRGTCPYGTRCRFIHTKPRIGPFGDLLSPLASPMCSPYSSPPSVSPSPLSRGLRTPTPPPHVPQWSSSWSLDGDGDTPAQEDPAPADANADEDGDGGDCEVPDSPVSLSGKRLAIFRTIC